MEENTILYLDKYRYIPVNGHGRTDRITTYILGNSLTGESHSQLIQTQYDPLL